MKNCLLLTALAFSLSSFCLSAGAEDLTISPDLHTNQGVTTDAKQINFAAIPNVKNTVRTNAKQQLSDFVKNVKSASGQFAQLGQGDVKKQAQQSGQFSFERPGKFVWHVTKPYEQQVISDGKTLYQYDPDLQQVTVRNVTKAVGASPASILFGSGTLDDSFTLSDLPAQDDMVWLRVTPKVSDAGLAHIDIAFANNLPAQLNVLDSFGKTTSIKLRDLKTNVTIPSKQFKFVAPAGVDTVKM